MINYILSKLDAIIGAIGWFLVLILWVMLHSANNKVDKLNVDIANKNAAIEQQNTAIADLGEQTKKAYSRQLELEKKVKTQREQDKAEVDKILKDNISNNCEKARDYLGATVAKIATDYNDSP